MTDKPRAADPDATGSVPGATDEPGGSTPTGPEEKSAPRVVIRNNRKINQSGTDAASAAGEDQAQRIPPAGGLVDDAEVAVDNVGESAALDDSPPGVPPVVDAPSEPVDEGTTGEAGKPATGDGGTGAGGDAGDGAAERATSDSTDGSADGTEQVETTGENALGAELEALRSDLEELTRDLQRVTAEYANYRKRVERDRGVVAEQTTGTVLTALLPILDDLDRAREHGDLVGPFGAVADQLIAALGKFGLTAFGEAGDPFDPTRHEAVSHQTSADVTEPTCVQIMRRGYLLGERLLRPALVGVADPE